VFNHATDHEVAYETREALLTKDKIEALLKERIAKTQSFSLQTKTFPKVTIKSALKPGSVNMGFALNKNLMLDNTHNRETLARLGLMRPASEYIAKDYLASLKSPDIQGQVSESNMMSLEFFSLLRTNMDVRAEYSTYEEVKKMR